MTVDPFAGSQTDPASLHRYLYANANPITFTDPTGQFAVPNLTSVVLTNALISVLIGGIIDVAHGKKPGQIVSNALTNAILGGISGAFGGFAAGGTTKLLQSFGVSFATRKGLVLMSIAGAKAAASTLVSMAKFIYDTKKDAAAGKPTASLGSFLILAGFTFTVNFAFELFFLGLNINKDTNEAAGEFFEKAAENSTSGKLIKPADLYTKFLKGSGDNFLDFFQDATNLPYIRKVLTDAGMEFNTVLNNINNELVKKLTKRLAGADFISKK